MKILTVAALLFLSVSCQEKQEKKQARADIGTKEIHYNVEGEEYLGFYAYPKDVSGSVPGVLVVHEWWGHNDYARKRAKKLAKEGYAAFALDMYGGGKTASHPEEAGAMSAQVKKNMGQATKRFNAGLEELKKRDEVDEKSLAAIGYCFGGGIVLEMARRGVNLDAIVSFHGTLATDGPRAKEGDIKAKILVANGAEDPFVKEEHIEDLKKEMKRAGADFRFLNLKGAKHSFTNPKADKFGKKFDLPLAYNKKADKKSWQAMLELFEEVFP